MTEQIEAKDAEEDYRLSAEHMFACAISCGVSLNNDFIKTVAPKILASLQEKGFEIRIKEENGQPIYKDDLGLNVK